MNASHVSSTGRRTQTKRKPRITPSAKLDLNGDQQYTTRNQTLSPSHSLATTPIVASNITASPPKISRSRPSSYSDKDKAKSDDGFHSDSDKESNHSNISIRQGKKYPARSSSLNKLEPSARIRAKTSSGSMSENVKIGNATSTVSSRSTTNDRSAEEAKQERKIADLEISIKSLMKINAELDETNKKQVIEIQELKRKLRMSDTFMFEIYDATEEDCVSTPSSELDFAETQKDNDIRFRRICLAIDEMLQTGKAALEHTLKIGGTRVLTEAQMNITDTLFPDKHNDVDSKTIGDTHSEAVSGRRTPTLVPDSVPTRSRSLDITKRKNNSNETRRSRNSMKTFASSDNLILANSTQNKLSKFDHDPPDTSATSTSAESNVQTPLSSNESSISVDSTHEFQSSRDIRIRAIIDELLVIVKHPSNTNSLTPPQTPGRDGLGWLLLNQDVKPTYFTHRANSGIVESSPAIPLLHELQDLLGYKNDAIDDRKETKNHRTNMPPMDVGKIHITPPDEEHLNGDNNRIMKGVNATSRMGNLNQKQKLIRRRSSPSFRASEERMNTVSERIGKGLSLSGSLKIIIDEEDEGEVNKGISWMSSLRFLSPWKAAD
ncbi:574_t:CDS:2 [Paraglomus occultum]|uniref:574_t:CDS:1 n=1 Tax=Paraglomus occultum TaxID=144539 RepID=A0A9N8WPI6_9GLOM|nr:574_t:CDS:2 [Paraglomus occultum]